MHWPLSFQKSARVAVRVFVGLQVQKWEEAQLGRDMFFWASQGHFLGWLAFKPFLEGFRCAVMDPATARAEVFVNGNGESSCTEPWQPGRLLGGLKVRIPWLRSSQQSKDDVK